MLTREEYEKWIREHFVPAAYSKWYEASPFEWMNFALVGIAQVGILAGLFAYRVMAQIDKRKTEDELVDGAQDLISANEFSKRVLENNGGIDTGWSLAGITIPPKVMLTGLLAVGGQRTGKSLIIHDMIHQSKRKTGIRRFINDPSGEFYRAHFRPGIDVMFSPSRVGSVAWSIFDELQFDMDTMMLAKAIKPDSGSRDQNQFWTTSAQIVIADILLRAKELGAAYTGDFAQIISKYTDLQLYQLLAGRVSQKFLSDNAKGMRDSIIATLSVELLGFSSVPNGNWTLKSFISQDEGDLYLVGDEAMYQSMKRCLLTCSLMHIEALEQHRFDLKWWYVLDEFGTSMGQAGELALYGLAKLGKCGVGFTLAVQALTQITAMMGKEGAQSLLQVLQHTVQLRTTEPDAQEMASKRFGQQTLMVVGDSTGVRATESQDGLNFSRTLTDRPLIPPANFGRLKDLTGYLQVTVDDLPSVRLNYRAWLQPGSAILDTSKTYVDELKHEIHRLPMRDPRFLIRVQTALGKERLLETIEQQIVSAKAALTGLTNESGIEKLKAEIALLVEYRDKVQSTPAAGSDENVEAEAESGESDAVATAAAAAGTGTSEVTDISDVWDVDDELPI